MAYPPRHGMPPLPFMGMPNVPPPGMPPLPLPPNMLSAPPPAPGATSLPFFSGPPPGPRGSSHNRFNSSHIIQGKPTIHHSLPPDHPSPIPMKNIPIGPPITVFVGNITDKWPDAMIRQLLSTCGHVINWKRVQGASGKLQGFGFCEFNGPDSGLRAVRLLHDLEVGDKKLVVKVDAKTNSLLEDFKADRKKKKDKEPKSEGPMEEPKESDDYMDIEMVEIDERARNRIESLFKEFTSELESYVPQGSDKPEKDPAAKQAIQDKLHLLKLTSLDAPPSDADSAGDAVVEEGKREIISQEITRFREHMKLEKEREEERKRILKERREREERDKLRAETEGQKSPSHKRRSRSKSPSGRLSLNRSPGPRSRSRSRLNDFRRDRRSRDRDIRDIRDRRNRSRDRVPRDFNRDRNRRSRDRRSPSRGRDRSPLLTPHKRKVREREEEEEAEEQRKRERKAREKLASYEDRVRQWEQREEKKKRERKKELERKQQALEDMARDAKKMKQFLQDYEDDKLDSKYYKGKELQKRLADRARELEMDNKDRQRERDEVEEMRLKLLTSGGVIQGSSIIPVITLDKSVGLKKPILDSPSTSSNHPQFQILGNKRPITSTSTTASRLQALAGLTTTGISQSNGVSKPTVSHQPKVTEKLPTSFSGVQFNSSIIGKTKSPILSTPSLVSPGGPPVEMSPSLKSLEKTGFTVSLSNHSSLKEDDTRQSFSSTNSPGMGSPGENSYRDDDSSLQEMSPDYHKKKKSIDVKDVFNQEDDDDGLGSARKRKLVPLDYGDGKMRKEDKAADDKKKHIKSLIDRIPTEKDALFAYEIDWSMVDDSLMEKRIRPWINKKIVEYIGEPEPTLVDFICAKVLAKSNPKGILEDVQMVLDEEAEVFVVKMWRLLVYEIEAKKIGLASKS